MHYPKPAFIIVPLLLVVSCTTYVRTSFQPADGEKYSPVERPARITRGNARYLKRRGYRYIGKVHVFHLIKECWKTCDDYSAKHTESTVTALRKEAAKKGGHLVKLTRRKGIFRKRRKKRGSCIQWKTEYYRQREFVKGAVGSGKVGHYEYVRRKRRKCVKYEVLRGVEIYRFSSGQVWRRTQ